MIYTCTLNPSLDYYMEFDKEIQLHQTNRSAIDYFDAGGKGINVSIVLSNLGVPSKALGFVGGFTKEFYVTLLERHTYLQPNFTYTEGITRINVKAVQGLTTELNAAGPNIDVQAQEAFLKRVARVGEEDIFVLSGNVQTALQDFIEEIIKDLASKGTKIVLDTDPTMLKRLIPYKPFLIKPNLEEFSKVCGETLNDMDHIITRAKALHDEGVENVIVSLSEKGSILACDQGIYKADILDEVVVGTTGSGDSMIAGFIFNSQRGFDSVNAYRYAACCGFATTYSKGLATRDKIESYFDQYEVKKIS